MTTDDSIHRRLFHDAEEGRGVEELKWNRGSSLLRRSNFFFFKITSIITLLFIIGSYGLLNSPLGLGIRLRHSIFSTGGRPLTVLISTADTGIGELDFWVHNILSRLGRPIDIQVINSHNLRIVDDSIVVGMYDLERWTELKVQSGLENVGILRIGDEKGLDTVYTNYAYAFRPYWFEQFRSSGEHSTPVLWIPNGYSSGVGPRLSSSLLPFSDRPQLCYFEGSGRDNHQSSSRERMRQALMAWDPQQKFCDINWTSGFMAGRPPIDYSSHLGRAKYALTPGGDSPETIRFYEALENNAIPIVVEEPWMTAVFGDTSKLPFIVLKSWEEVGPRLEALAAESPIVGQRRQTACRKWWDDLQDKIVRDAGKLVDTSFDKKYSRLADSI